MSCPEFVARFTDYRDGCVSGAERRSMEEHLLECTRCRRYKVVVEQGTTLLRSLPEPELADDFQPRLQHRLFHVGDHRALLASSASAAPALTVLGLAVLLTAVAWSPMLRGGEPVVDLAPIVVDRAPSGQFVRAAAARQGAAAMTSLAVLDRGLWDGARLYEYSALSQRYGHDRAVRTAGLEHDR
jgi:anti-sigma factor RsiW